MTRRSAPSLTALVQGYFQNHLRQARGASEHTVRAYRDSLRLFFVFSAGRARRRIADLQLDDIRSDTVLAFLDHLEAERSNGVTTRNARLAAVRGFASHLLRHDPTRAEQYRAILAIPRKRAQARPPTYLEPDEVRAVITQIPNDSLGGIRDQALLLFLYNTGARISEALAVRVEDLHLSRPLHVRLHGKGDKERVCPLWSETAKSLRVLLQNTGDVTGLVFRNARGEPLTRDGVAYLLDQHVRRAAKAVPSLGRRHVTPHVLRHSCAMALLQAGVKLTVIRDYLGHVSVATTGRYLSSNLDMKRKVLEVFWQHSGLASPPRRPWRPSPGLLAFLESL